MPVPYNNCMKKTIFAFIIRVSFSLSLNGADLYEYTNTIGPLSYSSFLTIAASGTGFTSLLVTPREKTEGAIDEKKEMKSFRFIDEKEKIDVSLIRKGNVIEATGTFRGAEVKKTIRIDEAPWYQILEINFAGFISSNRTRCFYWTFVGYQNDMYKLEAEKLGEETFSVNGKEKAALHIRIKPTGFYSLFWHGDFWFSAEDGSYLGYEAYEGFGAPLTITRFKNKTVTENGAIK
jgi:hypothetical protein